ncbi:MAG TPA: hypothetical protein G4N95_07735 [Anaerolineae bacterium]|nr:hypothetical protein [Anaerolineae bacterium]
MSKVKLAGVRSPLDDFPAPDELSDGEEAGKSEIRVIVLMRTITGLCGKFQSTI